MLRTRAAAERMSVSAYVLRLIRGRKIADAAPAGVEIRLHL
nr:hypothetical protein [Jiangella asiatica]